MRIAFALRSRQTRARTRHLAASTPGWQSPRSQQRARCRPSRSSIVTATPSRVCVTRRRRAPRTIGARSASRHSGRQTVIAAGDSIELALAGCPLGELVDKSEQRKVFGVGEKESAHGPDARRQAARPALIRSSHSATGCGPSAAATPESQRSAGEPCTSPLRASVFSPPLASCRDRARFGSDRALSGP